MILLESLEYRALPMQFYIFTFSGVWCPNNWNSPLKTWYNCYTIILATAGVLFWLTMLINLVMTRNESEYFYENVFAISTLTYAMYKEYFILRKRKEIKKILKICFDDEWFKPRNVYEQEIIEKYEYETRFGQMAIFIIVIHKLSKDHKILFFANHIPIMFPMYVCYRWITQAYALGIILGLTTKAVTPMLKSNSGWILPIEAWYPYPTDNLLNYLLSYVQQLMGGIPLICLHISVDSLFVGIVLQMCIQLKLLKHRLQLYHNSSTNMQHVKNYEDNDQSDVMLAHYAYRHACILEFGKQVNIDFKGIMTGQVMITIPNICINVYLLSKHTGGITLNLVDSFLCFATCLMQIFLYCWYGNKIILQSVDVASAIYEMNWTSLNISSKKKILTIMVRATKSIQFASGTFIMNLNSFIEIIKTSYSAFRVLQKTS